MDRIVIDASLAAAWCFPDEHTEYTNHVLQLVGETVDPATHEAELYRGALVTPRTS